MQRDVPYIKNLKRLHRVIVLMNIAMPTLVLLIIKFASINVKQFAKKHLYMQWMAPVLLVACILYAAMAFKKGLDAIATNTKYNLKEKLDAYRKACITRWSIIDLPIGFCTAMLLVTGKYYYLIFAFIAFVFMVLYTPSIEQVKSHLALSYEEEAILEDEYALV